MSGPPRHRFLVRGLIALGGVCITLGILAVWAERQVLNTDEWVDASTELLDDEEIQDALQAYLVEELFANVDVEAQVAQRLPEQAAPLAGPISGAVRQLANEVAERALDAPRVQAAWAEANRTAHELLLNLVEGDGELVGSQGGAVTLDLEALVAELASRLGISEDVAAKLPKGVAQLEIVQSDEIETAQTVAGAIRGLALALSLLGFGSLALAIYLSRGRRAVTVLWCGLTLILAGVAVYAIRDFAGQAVLDALVENEAARPAADSTWSIATSLLTSVATTVIVFGALFVVAAWLGSSSRTATETRRALAPVLRDHPGWAYGLVAVAGLVYFAAAPTHGVRALATLAVLVGLAAGGITGLRRQTAAEFPEARAGDTLARLRGAFGRGAVADAAPEDARIAQLERLARLREQGLLSDDELMLEKRRILGAAA